MKKDFIFEDIKKLKGIGDQLSSILRKENRENKGHYICFTLF